MTSDSTQSMRSFCKHTKTVGQKIIDLFQLYKNKCPNSTCTQGEFEDILFEENTRLVGAITAKCREYFDLDGKDLGYEKFIKEQEPISRKLWDRIINLFPSKDGTNQQTSIDLSSIEPSPSHTRAIQKAKIPTLSEYMKEYQSRAGLILKIIAHSAVSSIRRKDLFNNPELGLSLDKLNRTLKRMVKENLLVREGHSFSALYKIPDKKIRFSLEDNEINFLKMMAQHVSASRPQIISSMGKSYRSVDRIISMARKHGYVTRNAEKLPVVYTITDSGRQAVGSKIVVSKPTEEDKNKTIMSLLLGTTPIDAVKSAMPHIKVLELIRKKPGISKRELLHLSELSIGTFNKAIVKLVQSRLIEIKGTQDSRSWTQSFYAPEKAEPITTQNPEPYKRLLPHGWDTMDTSKRIDFVTGVKHEGFKEYLISLDPNVKKYVEKAKEKTARVPLNLYITIFSIPADNYSEESKNLLKTFVGHLNQIGRAKLQYVECSDPHMIEVREVR